MTTRLAIWDVDGTLVDSRSSIFRAAVEAAEAIGVTPPAYDQMRAIVGVSLYQALEMMRPDLDPPTIAAYTREFQQAFLRFHADPGFHDALYPGADRALRALKNQGWRLGMATGNSRRGVNRCLDVYDWHDLFDVTFCADDGPSKPHPHMVHGNLSGVGAAVHQAVMVGDTGHDMKMARQAGVRAIGVTWGFHTGAELHAAGADLIVHDFAELEDHLAAFVPQKSVQF